ncbi:MAG: hypothetical protein KF876_05285 [Nitrospira sp.]|nr:hypothetical protein [Nitrospira sp.]MBX3333515.1 hypothetical protein [Nitrospira sp.]
MRCARCQGLMVREFIVDLYVSPTGGSAWRCVSCGHLLDSVIASTKQRYQQAARPSKRSKRYLDLVAA